MNALVYYTLTHFNEASQTLMCVAVHQHQHHTSGVRWRALVYLLFSPEYFSSMLENWANTFIAKVYTLTYCHRASRALDVRKTRRTTTEPQQC